MRFLRREVYAACVAVSGFLIAGQAHAADAPPTGVFQVGFAERDISPEIGMEAPGGYGKSYHRSFHDPCKVRAAVFDDGANRVALVGIDALFIHRQTVESVRKKIEAHTGIPGHAVLLAASHSHSSGPMSGIMPGEFDHGSDLIKKLAYDHSTAANPAYLEKVETALVEAVGEANEQRAPSKAGIGRGLEDKVAFNRRFRMRSGLTVTHPRQGNPDILEVAGPTDPEVGVIGVWDDKQNLRGCVVNFACHATTSPGGISANYVHYLEQAIRGFYGPQVVVVFLNGASGDVTQVDNLSPFANPAPEQWAKLVGGRIGAEAVKVLLAMHPAELTPVAAKNTVLTIPRRAPDPKRLERCLAVVQKDPQSVDITEWTFAKEIVLLDATLQKSPHAQAEVQAVQVGPAVFVTTPAEYFCEYGLKIKENSKFPFTFPVSLANGCVGYVPTEDAFGPRGGGYETRLTWYSNLEPTAGTQMMNAGLKLTEQLSPGVAPQAPLAPAFQGPAWNYGNVPPELN